MPLISSLLHRLAWMALLSNIYNRFTFTLNILTIQFSLVKASSKYLRLILATYFLFFIYSNFCSSCSIITTSILIVYNLFTESVVWQLIKQGCFHRCCCAFIYSILWKYIPGLLDHLQRISPLLYDQDRHLDQFWSSTRIYLCHHSIFR